MIQYDIQNQLETLAVSGVHQESQFVAGVRRILREAGISMQETANAIAVITHQEVNPSIAPVHGVGNALGGPPVSFTELKTD